MTLGGQSNTDEGIKTANCMQPGCTFTWIGPSSPIRAQVHANRTGHIVDVQTTVTMGVEPGQGS